MTHLSSPFRRRTTEEGSFSTFDPRAENDAREGAHAVHARGYDHALRGKFPRARRKHAGPEFALFNRPRPVEHRGSRRFVVHRVQALARRTP
jgi:hypothetical protein